MNNFKKLRIIRIFSSLELTVVSLFLLMVLVFLATLSQVDLGIYFAKKKYFESWIVMSDPLWGKSWPILPGGLLVGWILVLNLLTAHFTRFKWTWKKAGLWLTHMGLLVLIVGSGLISMTAVESQMSVAEGQTRNYTVSLEKIELAVTEDLGANERVISIPQSFLKEGQLIQHSALPFSIKVINWYPNAQLKMGATSPKATQGIGVAIQVDPIDQNKQDLAQNAPTTVVELQDSHGDLGRWLLSTQLGAVQKVAVGGKTYGILLRQARYYLPFSITLLDFQHKVYPGTAIPKDFSSYVKIQEGNHHENARIFMNNPLRFGGKTFYQASFAENDTVSVFQVVENQAWVLPYVASSMIAIGLLLHFTLALIPFLKRKFSAKEGLL